MRQSFYIQIRIISKRYAPQVLDLTHCFPAPYTLQLDPLAVLSKLEYLNISDCAGTTNVPRKKKKRYPAYVGFLDRAQV